MTISELVKALELVKDKRGDLDVVFPYEKDTIFDVDKVSIIANGHDKNIIAVLLDGNDWRDKKWDVLE